MAILKIDEVERAGENGVTVLRLEGEIDPDTISLLKERLEAVTGRGDMRIVLDMGETTWISSSALAVLVKAASICREGGGGVALAGVRSQVRLVFEMLGLLPFFLFSDTVEEARAALAQE